VLVTNNLELTKKEKKKNAGEVAVTRVIIGQYFYAGRETIMRVLPAQCGCVHISDATYLLRGDSQIDFRFS